MSELRDLYQEMILDHGKNPRNFGETEGARECDGYNPLCGDRIKVFVKIEDDVIREVTFQGTGCAISTASASIMTSSLKGKTVDEAEKVFKDFRELVTGAAIAEEEADKLGKLAIFAGVSEFPTRVKCATLGWHTLMNAIRGDDGTASTE